MNHFFRDTGMNTFRVPVGWQFLLNNNLGGTLDSNNWNTYDAQIQGCLNTGAALCIIDIHNYARWNGAIVGQGGPTNAQFASLWSQIATKYKNNNKIVFGLMNEPVSSCHTPTNPNQIPLTLPLPARPRHQHMGHHRPSSRNRDPPSRRNRQQNPPPGHRLHISRRLHLQRLRRRSDESDEP